MAGVKITVKGLNEARRAFSSAPAVVIKELSNAVNTSVNLARPIMRKESPVDTGLLSRSIYSKADKLKGEVAPNLEITPYALYVHEGTRRNPRKNQFIVRTADQTKNAIQSIFNKAVDNIKNSLKF